MTHSGVIRRRLIKIADRYFLPAYLRDMKKMRLGGLSGGNDIEIIKDGDLCFDSFLSSIKKSHTSINLETYIFKSDEVGWKMANALAAASRRGVEVNVIYDSIGCIDTDKALFAMMSDAGVELIEFHPVIPWRKLYNVTFRDHRKILVIDGKTAFIGGINIANHYAGKKYHGGNWRDTHIQITGPAVKDIQYFFIENWIRSGGHISDYTTHFPSIKNEGNMLVMVLSNKSRRNRKPIRESYISAIRNAKKSIFITNAYFIPDARIYRELVKASLRGVNVSLILPHVSDLPIVKYAGMYLYKRYLKNGIKIYEYKNSILHAKTASIDGIWSTVGSSNLDRRSMKSNLELNAVILDQAFGRKMDAMFNNDLKSCVEITLEKYQKRSLWVFLMEWVAYRFRNFL